MIKIGNYNKLKVIKELDFGIYVDGEELGEILVPKRYVPENCQIDDVIDVFIYFDSEDRVIATTQKPYAVVGEFAFLKVVSVSNVGAFLDWGLQKDLFVAFREQKHKMKENEFYTVFVYIDKQTTRIAASSELNKFLSDDPYDFEIREQVDLLIFEKTDIGYKAIINNSHQGILYNNEVFQTLEKGQKIKGFIQKIREDKKIDLCLHKSGYAKIDNVAQQIINKLKKQNGFMLVTDKSSPKIIYDLFQISKKTYKKAVGDLYKKRLISIKKNGIKLIEK
jgi:uncharacterized protein